MFSRLLCLASVAFAVTPDLESHLAPIGAVPKNAATNFVVVAEPSTGCDGAAGISDIIGLDTDLFEGAGVGAFRVEGEPVVCDPMQDPPCLPRENKGRPLLPTGVVFEPIRTNYGHLKASLRYDVIQVNDEATADVPGYVAVRSLLALSNPTHVTRHVDVDVISDLGDEDYSVIATSNGDDIIDDSDYWILFEGADAFLLAHMYSPCTEDSHHFTAKSVSDDSCGGDAGLTLSAKVMVHEDHVSMVASILEVFPKGEDSNLLATVRARTRSLDRRTDYSDLHWFGDLAEKERLAIVNYCVDDDDGEDTSSDDDDSSSSSSISTTDYEGSHFNFRFHDHHCDNPLYSTSAIRYADDFSSEFSTSDIYTTSVDRVSDPSSWHKEPKEHKEHKHRAAWADLLVE